MSTSSGQFMRLVCHASGTQMHAMKLQATAGNQQGVRTGGWLSCQLFLLSVCPNRNLENIAEWPARDDREVICEIRITGDGLLGSTPYVLLTRKSYYCKRCGRPKLNELLLHLLPQIEIKIPKGLDLGYCHCSIIKWSISPPRDSVEWGQNSSV
jgi:hypothetical protein